jgi:hypothetical protein
VSSPTIVTYYGKEQVDHDGFQTKDLLGLGKHMQVFAHLQKNVLKVVHESLH